MNNIQTFTDSILEHARQQAELLLQEERKKQEQERAAAEQLLEEQYSQRQQQVQAQGEIDILAAGRQKKAVLLKEIAQHKQQLLENVFAETEETLCKISPRKFFEFYRKALNGLDLKGTYTIQLGEKTAAFFEDADWKELQVAGPNFSVISGRETIPGEGGFILTQPPVEYSFLFRELLAEIKGDLGASYLQMLLD